MINSNFIEYRVFEKYKSLNAFSTTINDGVSTGNYSSFNLGLYSGDIVENVIRNREKLCSFLNINLSDLFLPYQTHEDKVYAIDKTFLSKSGEEQTKLLHGVDSVVTDQKNICIGVTTADCVPILIFDSDKNILAAVHAGWRGTVGMIVNKTIKVMTDKFGSKPIDMKVAIGPSISAQYFEVGEEVVQKFMQNGFDMDSVGSLNNISGKYHIDLPQANKNLCVLSGIPPENIEVSGLCTYSNPQLFFSARRQSVNSGRMVTAGMLL